MRPGRGLVFVGQQHVAGEVHRAPDRGRLLDPSDPEYYIVRAVIESR